VAGCRGFWGIERGFVLKNPKYPKNPFFALRPETATGLYYYFMLKLLLGG
jgi:hypothetical protein